MIKVELVEAYGTGSLVKDPKYWHYQVTVMVKGSIKKAINHAYKQLWETAKDREGFNNIPVYGVIKVWKDGILILNCN